MHIDKEGCYNVIVQSPQTGSCDNRTLEISILPEAYDSRNKFVETNMIYNYYNICSQAYTISTVITRKTEHKSVTKQNCTDM